MTKCRHSSWFITSQVAQTFSKAFIDIGKPILSILQINRLFDNEICQGVKLVVAFCNKGKATVNGAEYLASGQGENYTNKDSIGERSY